MGEKISNNCPVCGNKIIGRRDKRFCDDHCRSSYHHSNNSENDKVIRNMNKRLKRNRKILDHFNELGKVNCTTQQLIQLGFDFSIHTSIYINEVGETCYYCYDRGYISKGSQKYDLVKTEFEELL